jgi:hypothetical protein
MHVRFLREQNCFGKITLHYTPFFFLFGSDLGVIGLHMDGLECLD